MIKKCLKNEFGALTVRSLIGEVAIHCMVRDLGPCVLSFCQPLMASFIFKNNYFHVY